MPNIDLKRFTNQRLFAYGLFTCNGHKYATDGIIMVSVETDEPGKVENWHKPVIALADSIRRRRNKIKWQPWPAASGDNRTRDVLGVKIHKDYCVLIDTLPNVQVANSKDKHILYLAFDGGVGAVAGLRW